jgi:hypothetical protein
MIKARITKIEECGNEIVLNVRIKILDKPIGPDQGEPEFNKEEKYINAEINHQKRLAAWIELSNDLNFLHLGAIELQQDYRKR